MNNLFKSSVFTSNRRTLSIKRVNIKNMLSKKHVMVVGGGGREHAICWKLQSSEQVATISAFPGSDAIEELEKVKVVKGLNMMNFQVGQKHAILSVIVLYNDCLPTSSMLVCILMTFSAFINDNVSLALMSRQSSTGAAITKLISWLLVLRIRWLQD